MLKQARKSRNANDWDRLKKESQAQCRQAHKSYVANPLSDDPSNNPKRFDSYVKSKRDVWSVVLPPLRREGRIHADPKIKAGILNNQFSSVFTKVDTDSLPACSSAPTQTHPTSLLNPTESLSSTPTRPRDLITSRPSS